MPEREPSSSGPISIDRTSPVPLYFQLAQHFESAIRSGALKVGARLENEVQLAERLGLSRPTVRAAFLYLANKGLVVRKRGAGRPAASPDRTGPGGAHRHPAAGGGRGPDGGRQQLLSCAPLRHGQDLGRGPRARRRP